MNRKTGMNAITKISRIGEARLERKILKRNDVLILRRETCNGCGLCIEVCPKDAITTKPAVSKEGVLINSPVLDIDEEKCILCGVCAVICPLNALEAWVNDEKKAIDREIMCKERSYLDITATTEKFLNHASRALFAS